MPRLAACDRDIELPFSDEEAGELIDKYLEARSRGDAKEAARIAKMFPLAPSVARAFKNVYGAEYVKNCGQDLSQTYKAFGDDWLDE